MQRFVSPPLDVPVLEADAKIDRADLVFYGVDHSGPSYQARVFVDAPNASVDTPQDDEHNYVGSYTVFGHDGCFGEEGHCLPGNRHVDEFDQRPPHPLTPWTRTVIAGQPLLDRLQDASVEQVTVTVVAVTSADQPESMSAPETAGPLVVESVRLLAYQD